MAAVGVFADSYSITVPGGGYALIANELNNSNTLASIFPNVPGGTTAGNAGMLILEWNCQAEAFATYYYKTGGPGGTGWHSTTSSTINAGTNTFVPGEGAILYNQTSTNYTFSLSGTANTPVLPIYFSCGCDAYYLLSGQTNAPAAYEEITGSSPQEGTQLFRYNDLSPISPFPPQAPNYTVYTYLGGAWTPSVPVANAGESVWIYPPCPTNGSCLVLNCLTNFEVACEVAWNFDTPTVLSSCCTNITNVTVMVTNGVCPQFITQSWLFTDACGNSSLCSQTVTVVSTTPPIIGGICVTNVYFAGGGNNFTTPVPTSPSSNLLARLVAAGVNSFKEFDDCTVNTFLANTFTNLPGCITAATLNIGIKPCGDVCENDTVNLSFTGDGGILLTTNGYWSSYLGSGNPTPGLEMNDWCSYTTGVVVTLDLANLPVPLDGGGMTTLNLLPYLNEYGFLDFISQDDSGVDYLQLQVISCCCATNKTVDCGSAWSFDEPTATDACSGSPLEAASYTTTTDGVCPHAMTRTWLFVDMCSNSNTCSQTVTLVDTDPPVFICADDKTVPCTASWTFDPPVAFDACGGTNVMITCLNTLTNGNGCTEIITRTWMATDCYGNTATCSQNVTLTDATAPLVTQQPRSQTSAAGANVIFSVTAAGTQPITYNWYFNGVQISSSSSNLISIPSAQIANAGNYWAVIQDAAGVVTSQVSRLNVLPQPSPFGLSLTITNSQSNLFVNILDDGSSWYPWHLQSTTNLSSGNWGEETNGAGNAQFANTAVVPAKFFRAGRLQPPPAANSIQAIYGGLPQAQFNTGLLMALGGPFNQSVLTSDGTPLDIDAPIPPSQIVLSTAFLNAYNTLRMASLDGGPTYPDLTQIKVMINSNAQPVTLEHNLAMQDIYALALTVIPYNAIASNAFTDGRLMLVDSNNVPIVLSNSNQVLSAVSVVQGTNSAPYVETHIFAGTGLFRTVISCGGEPTMFMLPKEFLVATGIVDAVQVRFPGVPLVLPNAGTNLAYDGFVDIAPDQVFSWDFSGVSLDTNGVAQVPMVVRATVGTQVVDAVTLFSLQPMGSCIPTNYCHATTNNYFYPPGEPLWWPQGEWGKKPSAQAFLSGPKPAWWPTDIPWPAPYAIYLAPLLDPLFQTGSHTYQSFGIQAVNYDPQAWGPLYNSDTGVVGQGTAGSNNWADGYNMRFYPATYRNCDPTRCQPINLVIIVDGIDILDDRTERDVWNDFGLEGQKILDKGYDLLVLNYTHGRDFIQRNAYALQTVLENEVPAYMRADHANDRVIIMCASMGTQVTRYALSKAEQNSQDHHTGLVIYLDGPFLGAEMPWSMQGFLQYLADNPIQPSTGAGLALAGLTSPAASQLLRTSLSYAPGQNYYNYYGEVSTFPNNGLPQYARNVAVACGSGLGYSPQGSQVGTVTWNNKRFAKVNTGEIPLLFTWPPEWAQATINAWPEPSPAAPADLLDADLQGGILFTSSLQDWNLHMSIQSGARPIDFGPGGWTALAQSIVQAYNDGAPIGMAGMTSDPGGGINSFIPTFSSLYVKSATNSPVPYSVTTSEAYTGLLNQGNFSSSPAYSGMRPDANFWYGPESGGATIDPLTPTYTPFDAIWYQYTNVAHVVTTGRYLVPGYEAFLFNELDQFTSDEPFSAESVTNALPKMPLHEEYLAGDLLGTGVDELLTINTFTRQQMVQQFDPTLPSGWKQLVDNSSAPGWIGSWAINKGDKFLLARLIPGGPKLLVSFSAASPAWAMVQTFYGNGDGTYTWFDVWDNHGNGLLGTFHIRPTNLYTAGDPSGSGFDKLLVAYPYVCNDAREKTTPGTSGLSNVSLLQFENGQEFWSVVWNNNANDMVGSTAIQFGERLMFGRLDNGFDPSGASNTLFSLNLLRSIFGGPTMLQAYLDGNWNVIFNDYDSTYPLACNGQLQCGGRSINFGCWALGNPRDRFYFADLDGDGLDELIAANDVNWDAYDFNGFKQFCEGSGHTDPYFPGNALGSYQLGVGDRFIFGHFDAAFTGDLVLSLNPLPEPLWCGTHKGAVLQQWTSSGWVQRWAAAPNTRSLGNWTLYQDLP